MYNGDERQHLNGEDHFTYFIDSKVVRIFRILKIIYICSIIIIMSLLGLYDNHNYSTDIIGLARIYIFIEIVGLLFYILKIRSRHHSRSYRAYSSIGILFRFFWIIWSCYGITILLDENKTVDSSFYYFLGYVFISNIIYLVISICTTYFIYCLYVIPYSYSEEEQSQRRATLSIVDDMSDLKLFSDILKIEGLFNDTSCSICFEDFENYDNVRILPCKHYYHINCINQWLSKNSNCPICRRNVLMQTV